MSEDDEIICAHRNLGRYVGPLAHEAQTAIEQDRKGIYGGNDNELRRRLESPVSGPQTAKIHVQSLAVLEDRAFRSVKQPVDGSGFIEDTYIGPLAYEAQAAIDQDRGSIVI